MKKLADKMKEMKTKENEATDKSKMEMDKETGAEDEVCVYQYFYAKQRVDLANKLEQYNTVKDDCAALRVQVDELEQNPPPQVFMNSLERYLFKRIVH